jgi:cystathionine beta-lyase family protein involved in aluminum resistance|tara:strand:+ start:397 stop:633 length:237 start_codon:yes stop_codon:yes gene_type:complete
MENKNTLSIAIRNQIKLVLLANSIGREELVTIALDKLEELINLIPQDIDKNGRKIQNFDDAYRWNGNRYVRRYKVVTQ